MEYKMLINTTKNNSNISSLILKTSSPRPIAWIVTEHNGIINIAPFSLFTPLSFTPPSLIVSIRTKDNGEQKDTLINLRKTQKCTICMVEESQLEKMNATADELPIEQSEAKVFDIEMNSSIVDGYPPMIAESPVVYFCELSDEVILKNDTTVPVILDIKEIYLDDKRIIDRDALSVEFTPVAHIAGSEYALSGEKVSI
jgi:flavin reductase (DIM6/NTAB) family NADH-FMN oxidoreductase RutF